MTTSTAVTRALLAALLVGAVASCDKDPAGPAVVDWETTAEQHRGSNNQRFSYSCPPNGVADVVWGVDLYSDDSSVCTAAVHAGKITLLAGGVVTFEIRPGAASYSSSIRNGIRSEPWNAWPGSFVFP